MRAFALGLAACLAGVGCGDAGGAGPSAPRSRVRSKPRVTVAQVEARELSSLIEAAGNVEASEEVSIPARVDGVVDALQFQEGDVVTEQTVLCTVDLERRVLTEQRAAAEAEKARVKAELAATIYRNREALKAEAQRQGKDWVTDEQLATWRADRDGARADHARAEADLQLARRSLKDARVTPPLAGVVNRKLVSRGEYVRPDTVVATILDLDPLHLRFTVPELEASRLAPGLEVAFSVRSHPGVAFRARLFHLGQKADLATRAVECKAEVLPPATGLRPGTYAGVRIETNLHAGLVVPETSVLPTERGFVAFVLEDGKARERALTLGLRVAGGIEVTAGVAAGETVVVDGASGLRDGAAVEVVER